MQDYVKPGSIAAAIDALQTPGAMPLCGGTDLLIKRRMGIIDPPLLVDISEIPDLRTLHVEAGAIGIGAAVPVTDIIRSPLVADNLPLLGMVLRKLGSVQIRNRAGLGGNLVNASPAADSAIPLLVYDAWLDIVGPTGTRKLPVEEFFRGPGKTALAPGELISTVWIPIPSSGFTPFFHKVGKRKALTIAIASIGAVARMDNGAIAAIKIAAGSVAPTPIRLRTTEERLTGAQLTPDLIARARESASAEVSPIDDIRGSAAYRRAVIGDLLGRFLEELKNG